MFIFNTTKINKKRAIPNCTLLAKNYLIRQAFNNNTFNYIHLNPGSLTRKLDQIKFVINNINVNIIGFCETWFDDSTNNNFVKINGFKLIRHDRKKDKKKRGGGIAFYIKDNIDYRIIDKSHGNYF